MSAIRQFIARVKKSGVKRPKAVRVVSMGRERTFRAWDIAQDTFVFEEGITSHLAERPSVLVVEKSSLRRRAKGRVMTISTGNHAVAAFPLLDGRFWRFSNLPSDRRGDVLMHEILCANVVSDAIEISQRDVPSRRLYTADEWLLTVAGFALNDIVMADRNETTLEHYRGLGQEWRMKPLAWTEAEMKVALAASRKRISSKLRYYHSARGVHFLSFTDFKAFASLAESEPEEFVKGLKELVSVFEGNMTSFARMPKYRGHHEIEFFGMKRGIAVERIVPELEKLMEAITLGRIGQLGVIQKAQEISSLFESLLTRPSIADDTSSDFTGAIYMYITGEIYSVVGEGSTPAFDDRRTALPGATFVNGHLSMHPGADSRTEVLLSNLRWLVSKDEIVEYANVYELRTDSGEEVEISKGKTREVVYKTNRDPLEHSMVEKRLSSAKKDYGSYMLARIGALKSLGIAMSEYRLLRRRSQSARRPVDYYIRHRCEGEPMESIPANYFCNSDDSTVEDREVVLALASLLGDAAAQNMAMKKYDPKTASPLFGVGKEIYEFEYDLVNQRVVPKSVATCSVRGSFGWPDTAESEENLANINNFYLQNYAHALRAYQRKHTVEMKDLAARFMDGFEYRTRSLAWKLSVMRDRFEAYSPGLPAVYDFDRKWRFVMWSLERQERRIGALRRLFFEKTEVVQNEDIRDNPKPFRIE